MIIAFKYSYFGCPPQRSNRTIMENGIKLKAFLDESKTKNFSDLGIFFILLFWKNRSNNGTNFLIGLENGSRRPFLVFFNKHLDVHDVRRMRNGAITHKSLRSIISDNPTSFN
ncbi:hypothetical protein ACOME3_010622 [Neoechinorhynchus agilis]